MGYDTNNEVHFRDVVGERRGAAIRHTSHGRVRRRSVECA